MTEDELNNEQLGLAIDRLDNVARSLVLPFSPATQIKALKRILPEIVTDLKAAFVKVTGENPWEDEP